MPIALVVCDSVYKDASGKQALIGLFNSIVSDRFPFVHGRLAVFVSLTSVRAAERCRLDIVHSESDHTVVQADTTLPQLPGGAASPTAIYDMTFEFTELTFPEPGRYFIRYFAGGMPLVMRPFDVLQRQKPPVAGPRVTPEGGQGG
jgi:hypothetical protein